MIDGTVPDLIDMGRQRRQRQIRSICRSRRRKRVAAPAISQTARRIAARRAVPAVARRQPVVIDLIKLAVIFLHRQNVMVGAVPICRKSSALPLQRGPLRDHKRSVVRGSVKERHALNRRRTVGDIRSPVREKRDPV